MQESHSEGLAIHAGRRIGVRHAHLTLPRHPRSLEPVIALFLPRNTPSDVLRYGPRLFVILPRPAPTARALPAFLLPS